MVAKSACLDDAKNVDEQDGKALDKHKDKPKEISPRKRC